MPPPSSNSMMTRKPFPLGAGRVPLPGERERERDVLLQNNPDFEIPGMRPPGRSGGGGGGGGMGLGGPPNGGGRMPVQTQMHMPPDMNGMPGNGGLTGGGRYPQP